jgi:hypothetical protein
MSINGNFMVQKIKALSKKEEPVKRIYASKKRNDLNRDNTDANFDFNTKYRQYMLEGETFEYTNSYLLPIPDTLAAIDGLSEIANSINSEHSFPVRQYITKDQN